jgi:hypothetical protein
LVVLFDETVVLFDGLAVLPFELQLQRIDRLLMSSSTSVRKKRD